MDKKLLNKLINESNVNLINEIENPFSSLNNNGQVIPIPPYRTWLSCFQVYAVETEQNHLAENELKSALLLNEKLFIPEQTFAGGMFDFIESKSSINRKEIENCFLRVNFTNWRHAGLQENLLSSKEEFDYETFRRGENTLDPLSVIIDLLEEHLPKHNEPFVESLLKQLHSQWWELNYMYSIQGRATYSSIDRQMLMEAHDILSDNPPSANTKLFELPDFSKLSWNDIFHLRKHPLITDYRAFVHSHDANNSDAQSIIDEINEAKLYALDELRPKTKGMVLMRIIENLPIPVVPIPNPIAAMNAYKTTVKEQKEIKRRPWLYFILDTRAVAHKNKK